MVGPTLPDKATWAEFKASRHDFEPGTCEHCWQASDKLIWAASLFVCPACKAWIETYGAKPQKERRK